LWRSRSGTQPHVEAPETKGDCRYLPVRSGELMMVVVDHSLPHIRLSGLGRESIQARFSHYMVGAQTERFPRGENYGPDSNRESLHPGGK
jgi:hypothetical protein